MLDPEKLPDTPVTNLVVHGIRLESRYQHNDEFKRMHRMVEFTPPVAYPTIISVFCDSKATHCYTVTVHNNCTLFRAQFIAEHMEDALDGHNGIYVWNSRGGYIWEQMAYWPGDVEDALTGEP